MRHLGLLAPGKRGRFLLSLAAASSISLLSMPAGAGTSQRQTAVEAADTPIAFPVLRSPSLNSRVSAKTKVVLIAGKGGATVATSKVVGGKGARKVVVKNSAKGYWTIKGDGGDTLDLTGVKRKVTIDLGARKKHQKVFKGLRLKLQENFSLTKGTPKNDKILGSGKANKIDGRKGNDVLKGKGGNDTLIGGVGNDALDGGPGKDTLDSGPSTAREFSYGGAGNDTLTDTDANDDTLYGGSKIGPGSCADGSDKIASDSGGNDVVYGGNDHATTTGDCKDVGDDIDVKTHAGSIDLIYGGNRNHGGLTSGGADGGDNVHVLGDGDVTVFGGNDNDSGGGADGADLLDFFFATTNHDNVMYGGNHNHHAGVGADGADILSGSDSIDNLWGGNRNEDTGSIGADSGDTSISGSGGNDTIYGGNFNLSGDGSDGGDTITGGGDSDDIFGGNLNTNDPAAGHDGGDTLSGGAGTDSLYGGNYNLAGDGNDSSDTLNGGSGNDTVYGGNLNGNTFDPGANGTGADIGDSIISDPASGADNVWGGNYNRLGCTGAVCGDGDDAIDVGDGEGNDKATGDNNNSGNMGIDTFPSPDAGDVLNVNNGT